MRRILKAVLWIAAGLAVGLVALTMWFQPQREARGTWLSEGYGLAIDIGRFRTDVYEVSAIHCQRAMTMPSNTGLLAIAAGYSFVAEEGALTIRVDEIANAIDATRAALPAACSETPEPTPEHVYAVFWESFAEHYVSFDIFGIDWRAHRDPGPIADDAALRAAMVRALDGMADGHVFLATGPEDIWWPAADPSWTDEVESFSRISETMLSDADTIEGAGITHGWLPDNVAYIRMDHMEPGRALGRHFTPHAIDLLRPLAGLYGQADGVVLDIRWNTGGYDTVSLGYAALFASTPWDIGTKLTQTGPGTFTAPLTIRVRPDGAAGFDMPVILLTSELTVSAGEIFTMAMRELPQVTVMGTATSGAFSDMLMRELPNGWVVSLSHQVYRTPEGANFEGRGLPPDIARPFDATGLRAGRDELLAEAAAALTSGVMPSE